MKLSAYRQPSRPYIMIIPMIDIIFFLLVFYMMSTLYMTEQRSISVQLPQAQHAAAQKIDSAVITISAEGEIKSMNPGIFLPGFVTFTIF